MQYTLMLWPHANARYQLETRRLALSELRLMLEKTEPGAAAQIDEAADYPCLSIEAPGPLSQQALQAIGGHSLLYLLMERRGDHSLMPVAGRDRPAVGADLPSILKYKGKTNEMFMALLINVALYSGEFYDQPGPLQFLDPMCGRATAPFIALNRGFHAIGSDVDRGDLQEAERFLKRYLEYHRLKHGVTHLSRTLRGGGSAPQARFELKDQGLSLDLIQLDAGRAAQGLRKNSVHLIACDLPYGVRHEASPVKRPQSGSWLEALLREALPQLHALLKPGGTAALSFNAQTFKRDRLLSLMAEAGFEVLTGGPYEGFEHWVEQAITRDIAVGRKS